MLGDFHCVTPRQGCLSALCWNCMLRALLYSCLRARCLCSCWWFFWVRPPLPGNFCWWPAFRSEVYHVNVSGGAMHYLHTANTSVRLHPAHVRAGNPWGTSEELGIGNLAYHHHNDDCGVWRHLSDDEDGKLRTRWSFLAVYDRYELDMALLVVSKSYQDQDAGSQIWLCFWCWQHMRYLWPDAARCGCALNLMWSLVRLCFWFPDLWLFVAWLRLWFCSPLQDQRCSAIALFLLLLIPVLASHHCKSTVGFVGIFGLPSLQNARMIRWRW